MGITSILLENSVVVLIYQMGDGEGGCCMPRLTNDFAHAKYCQVKDMHEHQIQESITSLGPRSGSSFVPARML
jgi:hypothetical protein